VRGIVVPLVRRRSALAHEYDGIVVGSGSGGAVVAGTLREGPDVSILVLDVGGRSRPNRNVQIPAVGCVDRPAV
jgi:choline dehydrogenase-like flavoprotein